MGAHFWPAPPAAASGTPPSSVILEGAVPAMADWTVNTAGSFNRADSAGGIRLQATGAGTVHIETRLRSGSNTTATFGCWGSHGSPGQASGIYVGWCAAGAKGYGMLFSHSEGFWSECQINLATGAVATTGNFLAFEAAGAPFKAQVVIAGANSLVFKIGDGYGYYGQVWDAAYQAFVGVGVPLDTVVWGAVQGSPAFGGGKLTCRLWDYVEAA